MQLRVLTVLASVILHDHRASISLLLFGRHGSPLFNFEIIFCLFFGLEACSLIP